MNFRAKTVQESIVETVHIIRPSDLNDAGRLFGGVLMQWIDEVAALVAKRHSQMNVTTASVDNLMLTWCFSARCHCHHWKSHTCWTYFHGS